MKMFLTVSCVLYIIYWFLILVGLTISIYKLFIQQNDSPKSVPSITFKIPFIGYILFLGKHPHIKLVELGKKYGSVFSIRMGSMDVVILNNYTAIREAFHKNEFLGRPEEVTFNVVMELQGLGTLSGPRWRDQKRFTMYQLRNLGFGKTTMEEHIKCEMKELIERIEQSNGEPIQVRSLLASSTSSNISALVFGKRFLYDDPDRIQIDNAIQRAVKKLGSTGILTFFPQLSRVFARLGIFGLKQLKQDFLTVNKYIVNKINEHEQTLDENNVRDYIDGFLIEMKKHQSNPRTTFTKKMLAGNVQGFFAAGSETVKTTIEWALLIAAGFPDVQKKIHHEIDQVVSENIMPSWIDRHKMTYTQAVINEIHRWKTISPLNLLRQTLDDVYVQGYHVPKGTNVIANLWSVHHDPLYWRSPEQFIPERFLDENNQIIKYDAFMPFSIGKRSCPGETFAQVEVFLCFTALLQRFNISSPDKVSFEEELGLISQPKRPVVLKFEKRFA